MKLTIELSNISELERILVLFKTLELENVKIVSPNFSLSSPIQKGNKKINPRGLFGIWKDNPKNIEEIRRAAWKRN